MRTLMRRRLNRRGFTLVVMMMMMTVFIGAAAFATDFGKMYLIRGQLQATADATALAGIFWVAQGGGASSYDTARAYAAKHKVGTAFYPSGSAVVNPGTWDTLTATFTGNGGNWTAGSVDAVQAIVSFTGSYNFGRFFGFNSKVLYDTAVAIRGSVNSSTCVRPWAIPYQALLDVLNPGMPTTYELTEADINTLRTYTTAQNIQLKVGTAGGYTEHGEFYAVRLGPKYFADGTGPSGNWSGANDYGDGISGTCGETAALISSQAGALRGATVSVNDFLERETGNKVGQTRAAVNAICGGDVCATPYKVTAALWDTRVTEIPAGLLNAGASCECYHIKYLGAFAITGWDQTNGAVNGFFTSMATNGGITPGAIGPSQGVGLRK